MNDHLRGLNEHSEFINSFIHPPPIHQFVHSPILSFIHSSIHSSIHSFIPFIHASINLLIHPLSFHKPLTHSFIYMYTCIHLSIHLQCIHFFIHPSIHYPLMRGDSSQGRIWGVVVLCVGVMGSSYPP